MIKYEKESFKIQVTKTRAYITAPYNPDFITKMNQLRGRWIKETHCWEVMIGLVEDVRAAMREVYGTDDLGNDDYVTLVLRFAEVIGAFRADVTMYGKVLSHATAWNSGGSCGEDVHYLTGKPESGGSTKNWSSIVPAGAVVKLARIPRSALSELPPSGVSVDILANHCSEERRKLEEEKAALLKRVAEIDNLLADPKR